MKKKILLSLLSVALIIAGTAVGVYAAGSHEPVHGNKLVGCAPLGMKEPDGQKIIDDCLFRFTNPDCVNDIIIERVSIINSSGVAIYEGPFLGINPDGSRVPIRVLPPHRVGIIELHNWMYLGGGVWKTELEARSQPTSPYTVEIEWSAKKDTCPLTGYGEKMHSAIITDSPSPSIPAGYYPVSSYIPMVNMTERSR